MSVLLFSSAVHPLLLGCFLVMFLIGILILVVIVFAFEYLIFYIKEITLKEKRPPVADQVFNQLKNFNRLFDYQTSLAHKHSTYCIIARHSEIYTANPAIVEYILKTNFPNYGKGPCNSEIMRDLFGDGIFAVDGDQWRHQRKLASYEFLTKVLRDFSSSVFRANASKLVSKVTVAAASSQIIDLQDMLMKSTSDSTFKVVFGVHLNSLLGLDDIGNRLAKAFNDSNELVFWRYVDLLWKIKRFLNIGSEASLKKNIQIMDDFIL